MELQVIQNKIYEIRGQRVMLDRDLAELYDVQTKVLNQAVTYACFICKLLRSESGAKWAKLFKFTNPEELLSKPLIVDAIAAMPNISPEDSALFNLEKPARIKVGEDLIELHFISFEDNKTENKLGNIKTSLRK